MTGKTKQQGQLTAALKQEFKELMGHSTIQMTERYTHSRSEAKMEAVNSLDWDLHNEKSPMSVKVS